MQEADYEIDIILYVIIIRIPSAKTFFFLLIAQKTTFNRYFTF